MGTKASDRFAMPLCQQHHRLQHSWGWKTFEDTYGIDGLKQAERYWWAWPGRIAWERKLNVEDVPELETKVRPK